MSACYVACNCYCFLSVVLIVSAYIFVSHMNHVPCSDCPPVACNASLGGEVGEVGVVGDGDGDRGGGVGRSGAVRAFGADGGGFDYVEYPAPEFCDETERTLVGMSMVVMAVCAFLICNTCPEYCLRKRIDLDGYKSIVVEKECGCAITYDAFEEQ